MKKFRTATYNYDIESFEVVKETKTRITFIHTFKYSWPTREESEKKDSRLHKWFDTFEDAKNYLIKQREHDINSCLLKIQRLNSEIDIIRNVHNSPNPITTETKY